MAKMNISVPDELKQRMDRWLHANWSKIAQDAFWRAVEINELKGTSMEDAGIARLRTDREQHKELLRAEGVKVGKEWALNEATYVELNRIQALRDSTEADVDMQELARAITGDDGETKSSAADMAETIFGRQEPNEQELLGFIEGVLEVFDRV